MNTGTSTGDGNPSATSAPGRFSSRRLRRASFILPLTGERSKRSFTLREASHRDGHVVNKTTPLLDGGSDEALRGSSWSVRISNIGHRSATDLWTFAKSSIARGIFKCSLAYLLGSLVTFVPALRRALGVHLPISKQMVCTALVWFHPARTTGSMQEATVLAIAGLLYASVIGYGSMSVSVLFGSHDMLILGHVIVLIVFIGAGLGFVAWVKQRLNHPLVNVACSLASLACILILVSEGSVQAGTFSNVRVTEILLMVLMGIVIASAINVIILPITARSKLTSVLEKNTALLGEMLLTITKAFLSGRESDLSDQYYETLSSEHQGSLKLMHTSLDEAKREYLLLGREKQHEVEERLVECLSRLAQDLGGLRSAAFAQFAFMKEESHQLSSEQLSRLTSPIATPSRERQRPGMSLNAIAEALEIQQGSSEGLESHHPMINSGVSSHPASNVSLSASGTNMSTATPGAKDPVNAGDLFFAFLVQLGPPTKSLVFTLKQILDELPFEKDAAPGELLVGATPQLYSSLSQATELYRQSRKDALGTLYQSRASLILQRNKDVPPMSAESQQTGGASSLPIGNLEKVADLEEVAACCAHFSFALLDFAEDVHAYLGILEDLDAQMASPGRSWAWLLFWRDFHASKQKRRLHRGSFHEPGEGDAAEHPTPKLEQKADHPTDMQESIRQRPISYRVYKALSVLRRDDVRFAIKVGIGAVLYSMPAFIESSRPFFVHWRGEWGLVSYMTVCCMTIGASNTTSINRFIGTGIGAFLAIIFWVIANDHGRANPWLLAFFGWLVANGCFYLILAKDQGPMGRFILLTYNLGALYAYSLSLLDEDDDEDPGGIDPAIWSIVVHRLISVVVGCLWAIIITRVIWPISARRKLQHGLCILWLRMSLIWKRDPLALFLLGAPRSSYMDIREEAELQSFLSYLTSLKDAAKSEYELRGPFPEPIIGRILERTGRMLDAFHAMNVVINKNLQYTPGEAAVLRYTRAERSELSARISHLYSVLASSIKLEYPLNDVLPSVDHTRDRLLARIAEFRRSGEGRETTAEQDFELIYAYVLVTGQLSNDIQAVSSEIELLFGTLNEENLKLQ